MNQAECDYWDERANRDGDRMVDNLWKRERIVHRLLRDRWVSQRVLEIGVGYAQAAAALSVIVLGKWSYIGTDVSQVFCDSAKKHFNLNVVHTDILELPHTPEGYTRVIALDTLEHVHPNDRDAGYMEIGAALAEHARFYIHYSLGLSTHDKRFDHPFGFKDIQSIMALTGMRLVTCEEYGVNHPNGLIPYVWVVLQR